MGCNICSKKSQIDEPLIKNIEKKVEEIDPFKFDPKIARKLIKILLSEDKLYNKTLNYIILFDDVQLEKLFFGDYEYKNFPYHNIPNSLEFKFLLYKFEDFSEYLFEWYKDETKYDNLIKLWKSKDCISKYNDYSNEKLEEEFRKLGIDDLDNFITEFRSIDNNSINKKARDIKNYLIDTYDDFSSLLHTTLDYKKDFEKTNIEKKEIYTLNLENIAKQLIKQAFPLVKSFIFKKYPQLNICSQIQLKRDEMIAKLTKKLFGEIKLDTNTTSKGIGFQSMSQLIDSLKNGSFIKDIWSDLKVHYNNPTTAYVTLATSFLNLVTSIKEYHDTKIEMENFNQDMKSKFEELEQEYEMIKNGIGELDLDNYEESIKKIKEGVKKISIIKIKRKNTIDKFTKKKEEKEKEKKEHSFKDALQYGGAMITSAVGIAATGGLMAAAFTVATIANGASAAVSFFKYKKMKEKLSKSQKILDEQIKKDKEIDDELNKLESYYNQLQNRYIPGNVLNED